MDFASPDMFSYRASLHYRCWQGITTHRPNGSLDLEPAEGRVIQQLDGTLTIAEIIAWATSGSLMFCRYPSPRAPHRPLHLPQ